MVFQFYFIFIYHEDNNLTKTSNVFSVLDTLFTARSVSAARSIPSLVRSLIRFRSNSAKAANIYSISFPSALYKSATVNLSKRPYPLFGVNTLIVLLLPLILKPCHSLHMNQQHHILFNEWQ